MIGNRQLLEAQHAWPLRSQDDWLKEAAMPIGPTLAHVCDGYAYILHNDHMIKLLVHIALYPLLSSTVVVASSIAGTCTYQHRCPCRCLGEYDFRFVLGCRPVCKPQSPGSQLPCHANWHEDHDSGLAPCEMQCCGWCLELNFNRNFADKLTKFLRHIPQPPGMSETCMWWLELAYQME